LSIRPLEETISSPPVNGWMQPLELAMRRYAAMVFRISFGITGDVHDAEDATQATFLALHEHLKQGLAIHHIGGWLGQVARRSSLDFVRGRNRRRTREQAYHAISPSRVQDPDGDESKAIVGEELDKLPAKYRLVLILHYFGGMTHEEIARQVSCKPGTLRVRLHRAKEMLGHRLSARGIDTAPAILAVTMERFVHNAVTESIVSSARKAMTTVRRLPAKELAPHAGRIIRAALLGAKLKVAVGVAVLAATTMTVCMPQSMGLAAGNLARRLPGRMSAVWIAMARPSPRLIPPKATVPAAATIAPGKLAPPDQPSLALAEPALRPSAPWMYRPSITVWSNHDWAREVFRPWGGITEIRQRTSRVDEVLGGEAAPPNRQRDSMAGGAGGGIIAKNILPPLRYAELDFGGVTLTVLKEGNRLVKLVGEKFSDAAPDDSPVGGSAVPADVKYDDIDVGGQQLINEIGVYSGLVPLAVPMTVDLSAGAASDEVVDDVFTDDGFGFSGFNSTEFVTDSIVPEPAGLPVILLACGLLLLRMRPRRHASITAS
jgi:RNA polymerase sigma factor (sigma-70 family)